MLKDNQDYDYAPYIRDGLLCLPDKTVHLLISAGLNRQIAEIAQRGLLMRDPCYLEEIRESLRLLLARISSKNKPQRG